MRHLIVFALVTLLGLPAQAQEDTAYHRGIYKEVNDHLGEYSASDELKIKRPGDDQKYKAKAWWQAHTMRKLEITEKRGDFQRTTEFYYNSDAALIFVYYVDVEGGKRSETRLYFSKDGTRLIKWLVGKEEIPKGSHDFDRLGEDTIAASQEFQQAIGE